MKRKTRNKISGRIWQRSSAYAENMAEKFCPCQDSQGKIRNPLKNELSVSMFVCSAGFAEVGPMLLLFFPSLILKTWGKFLFQLFWSFIFSFPGYFGNTCLAPSPLGLVLREGTAPECDSLFVGPHLGTSFSLDELLRGS